MSVALIVIYNHKYEKNIEVIEKIYQNRFQHIYHLMPFYTGDKENVISVYECSYYFEGYVAQAFKNFYHENHEHYFFIADDMIVNPAINEFNYKEYFNLDAKSGFITSLSSLPHKGWSHNRKAMIYNPNSKGSEVYKELPDIETANKIFADYSVTIGKFSKQQIYFHDTNYRLRNIVKQVIIYLYDKKILMANFKKLKYPLAFTYSDIFIVSQAAIKKFMHLCGVFASTELWVELAIPTALMLSGEKIITEQDTKLKGRALWDGEIEKELSVYHSNLKILMNNFPENYIYLHPVKLSAWNCNEI